MDKKETFKQFWKLYPRKIAKLVAERSWKRLPKKDINAIFKVLHEHLIRWKYKEIQYIPHASTWLNQRRWEDELEPIRKRLLEVGETLFKIKQSQNKVEK